MRFPSFHLEKYFEFLKIEGSFHWAKSRATQFRTKAGTCSGQTASGGLMNLAPGYRHIRLDHAPPDYMIIEPTPPPRWLRLKSCSSLPCNARDWATHEQVSKTLCGMLFWTSTQAKALAARASRRRVYKGAGAWDSFGLWRVESAKAERNLHGSRDPTAEAKTMRRCRGEALPGSRRGLMGF